MPWKFHIQTKSISCDAFFKSIDLWRSSEMHRESLLWILIHINANQRNTKDLNKVIILKINRE